ncbi:MAG: hypothetical protein AAFP97_06570 [Pseudomonadota bacterium]
MFPNLHSAPWYVAIGFAGAALVGAALIYDGLTIDNIAVICFGASLFFWSIGVSISMTYQEVILPAEMNPAGIGNLKGSRTFHKWCVGGVLFYIVAVTFVILGIYRLKIVGL